jgi:hypothetical protein
MRIQLAIFLALALVNYAQAKSPVGAIIGALIKGGAEIIDKPGPSGGSYIRVAEILWLRGADV